MTMTGYVWRKLEGSSIDDLTLDPSIDCTPKKNLYPNMDDATWKIYVSQGCKFHGWVKKGKVIW